jgi:hypothetical protein
MSGCVSIKLMIIVLFLLYLLIFSCCYMFHYCNLISIGLTSKEKSLLHNCHNIRRIGMSKIATKFWVCEKVKDWLIENASL